MSVQMDKRIQLRCSDDELKTWRSSAKKDGRTLSDWLRNIANLETAAMLMRGSFHRMEPIAPATKPSVKAKKGDVITLVEGKVEKLTSNAVCKVLGHSTVLTDGKMVCSRCGLVV